MKPQIIVSPMYLELLCEALKRTSEPIRRIEDFGAFLNDLKFELRSNGNNRMADYLVAEEIDLIKKI